MTREETEVSKEFEFVSELLQLLFKTHFFETKNREDN